MQLSKLPKAHNIIISFVCQYNIFFEQIASIEPQSFRTSGHQNKDNMFCIYGALFCLLPLRPEYLTDRCCHAGWNKKCSLGTGIRAVTGQGMKLNHCHYAQTLADFHLSGGELKGLMKNTKIAKMNTESVIQNDSKCFI